MVLNTVDHIDELELAGFDKAKDLGMPIIFFLIQKRILVSVAVFFVREVVLAFFQSIDFVSAV